MRNVFILRYIVHDAYYIVVHRGNLLETRRGRVSPIYELELYA